MQTYLDFEKPIAELERRLSELRETASEGSIDLDSDVERLEAEPPPNLTSTIRQWLFARALGDRGGE